ncbi:MAG TPA: hypothetical protein VI299_06445 [Polyangiales bacterium]
MRSFCVLVFFVLTTIAARGSAQTSEAVERQRIELRLHEITQESAQLSLAWPIALTATGVGAAVVLALSDFEYWFLGSVVLGDEEGPGRDERQRFRRLGFASAGAALVGVAGLGWMAHRVRERRSYRREARSLKERQMQLLPSASALSIGLNASMSF